MFSGLMFVDGVIEVEWRAFTPTSHKQSQPTIECVVQSFSPRLTRCYSIANMQARCIWAQIFSDVRRGYTEFGGRHFDTATSKE